METLAAPVRVFNLREPIPGYVLKERLGAGGYGEVWKADAPGGLTKAVKIVFGQLNGERAEREWKALNRIKEVSHPFLLSLERIEVVDDYVIIVTELAEASLRDRFQKHVETGLPGIPRDQLLEYLRDAADALDYLYDKHALQHLDVKPENLLLLANRVKVADFGLLKDLHDASASLVGGLTPLYAPPEVFDGRPNRHSDQYSLAVVYQEMLTGKPPFGGRTAAQLAAQHLHSQPVLSSLPNFDQPIITRALSKDPERRFSNCRALVDSLLFAPEATSAARQRRSASQTTMPLAGRETSPAASRLACTHQTYANQPSTTEEAARFPKPRDVRSLPPLLVSMDAVVYRPTVFVGVGGTAQATLRRLRRRLCDRFGNLDQIPALQMLLLDIDLKALTDATRGEDGEALRLRETVAMPLREPKEYRSKSQWLLEWMNRRWLYNIPRSLQTEGIRPLGRLALIDHFDRVDEFVRCAIASATSPESLRVSSENAGIPFGEGPPRVFVIASTAGGTGSGAVLDLAYAVRTVLAEFELADDGLCGILIHSTAQRASARDLAIANTLACLSELRHYGNSRGQYPGEPACGIPPFRDRSAPFAHTYVVHLGDELSETEFHKATLALAEYLYRNCATPAAALFDQCRHAQSAQTGNSLGQRQVRTLGLAQLDSGRAETTKLAAEILCHSLVCRWIEGDDGVLKTRATKRSERTALLPVQGEPARGIDPEFRAMAAHCAEVLELRLDRLVRRADEVIRRELNGDAETYFRRLIAETRAGSVAGSETTSPRELARIVVELSDAVIVEGRIDAVTTPQFKSLRAVLEEDLKASCGKKGDVLRHWFCRIIDTPNARVHGAQQATRWFQDHLKTLDKQLAAVLQRLDKELLGLAERAVEEGLRSADSDDARKTSPGDAQGGAALLQYARLRLDQVVHQAVSSVVRAMSAKIAASADELDALSRRLEQLAQEFAAGNHLAAQEGTGENTPTHDARLRIREVLSGRQTRLLAELECRLDEKFFSRRFPLSRLSTASADMWSSLLAALREESRSVVRTALKEINFANAAGPAGGGDVDPAASLGDCLKDATPKLLDCGGAKRLVLIAPKARGIEAHRWQEAVRRAAKEEATVVFDAEGDIVVCYEVEQTPLENILVTLTGGRHDYLRMASRLHTRTDVDWSPVDCV